MKLRRLELFGFKSFYHRTVFQFEDGITSIVGPNGCGKSNVVDAVVWVLGERGTKSLRIKDMGDVIFHGSNGKRPVNIAEVTLDLSDETRDVSVKRRIYRDGTSEFFLNGESVRLKDVQDFFLGTGVGVNSYAIVEQGKIEYFTHMKPQERRIVIEETSGITRFEEKKREAITRLAEVSANLERVEDIYREVKVSFEKAEVEWHRWKIYKELADRQAEIEKWILLDGFQKVTKRIAKITERHEGIDKEIAAKEEEKARLREQIDAKDDEFSLVDSTCRKLEVDIKGKEKDMENRLLELDYLKGELLRLEDEMRSLDEDVIRLDKTSVTYREEMETLKASRIEHERSLAEAEDHVQKLEEAMSYQKRAVEDLEQKIEAERVALFVAMSTLTETKNRIAEIERHATEKQRKRAKWNEEQSRLNSRLTKLESSRIDLQSRLDGLRAHRETIATEETKTSREREKVARLVEEQRVALESLRGEKRAKEEFLKQMAALKSDRAWSIPDTRRLIDLVRSEEEREKALERFFFRELEYHVLGAEDMTALADIVEKYEGNFIFFPKKGMFRKNFEEVELDVRWIGDIREGLKRIEAGEEGIFMNEEVLIDSRGLILREKEEKKVDLKQFRERRKAEKALKDIEGEIEKNLSRLKELQDTLAACDTSLRQWKGQKDGVEKEIRGLERDLVLVDAEAKLIRERLGELGSEINLLEETPEVSVEDLMNQQRADEEEKDKRERNMAFIRQQIDKAKAQYEETRTKWQNGTIDIERQRNALKMLDEDLGRKVSLIEEARKERDLVVRKKEGNIRAHSDVAAKADGLEKDYEAIKESVERDIRRYEELKIAAGNLHLEKQGLLEKHDVLVKDIERTRNRKEGGERELAVLAEKRDTVLERLATTYGIDSPEHLSIPQDANFEAERDKVVAEISELGEVNFRAETEYRELKERVAFLEQQKEDLHNAMDSLKKTIARIDGLSKDIFVETFETVNSAYKKFVQLLFKGGQGYLAVSQDGSGIEMYAQPPGKKVARMEQLSGGEKALVSLGFLLALMDTKPSPFSLMDEIDAPLDDANLMGLMEIIKEISRKTQVIFITHNRITMESSNTIYGITMEDEGVSKVVSVRL